MKPTMARSAVPFGIILASTFALLFSTPAYADTCSGNVCLSTVSNLPSGSTGVDQNRTVRLTFGITPQTGNVCQTGNLYHVVRQYVNGQNNYAYFGGGAGDIVTHDFNSGPGGQPNKYDAIFYCNGSQISGSPSLITSQLALLSGTPGKYWATETFDLRTRQTNGGTPNGTPPGGTPNGTPPGGTPNGTPPGGTPNQVVAVFENPLAGTADNLVDFILRILRIFIAGIGLFAVLFIIIGGFRLVFSQGDSEAAEGGKKTITYAVAGLVVALISFAFVAIVQNLLGVQVKTPQEIISGQTTTQP